MLWEKCFLAVFVFGSSLSAQQAVSGTNEQNSLQFINSLNAELRSNFANTFDRKLMVKETADSGLQYDQVRKAVTEDLPDRLTTTFAPQVNAMLESPGNEIQSEPDKFMQSIEQKWSAHFNEQYRVWEIENPELASKIDVASDENSTSVQGQAPLTLLSTEVQTVQKRDLNRAAYYLIFVAALIGFVGVMNVLYSFVFPWILQIGQGVRVKPPTLPDPGNPFTTKPKTPNFDLSPSAVLPDMPPPLKPIKVPSVHLPSFTFRAPPI